MARQVVEADVPVAEERRVPMTYEAWLTWEDGSFQSEWEDGEAIVFMPTKVVHNIVAAFLIRLLGGYADLFDLGIVIGPPTEMRLKRSAREPDVIFIAQRNLNRLTPDRLKGPADLVIEIVSDDSVTRDRVRKLAEYAEAGVPEYWIFDPRPRRRSSEFYQLTEQGIYRPVPPNPDGRYHSLALPGFWLRPDWLWQEPLPKPAALLAEIVPMGGAR